MKRTILSGCLFGYLVLSIASPSNAADLVTKSKRVVPKPQPYTVIVSSPNETRIVKAEQPSEESLPSILHLGQLTSVTGPVTIQVLQHQFDVLENSSLAGSENSPLHTSTTLPTGTISPQTASTTQNASATTSSVTLSTANQSSLESNTQAEPTRLDELPQVIYSTYQSTAIGEQTIVLLSDEEPVSNAATNSEQADAPERSELASPSDSQPAATPEQDATETETADETSGELDGNDPAIDEPTVAEEVTSNATTQSTRGTTGKEHEIHLPLKLPENNALPNVDLKDDPVYQELLKAFKGAMNEPFTSDREDGDEDGRGNIEASNSSKIKDELVDEQYHAAEELLKVARSLEKPAKKLKKADHNAEALKIRKAIAKIRKIAHELTQHYDASDD